MKVEDNPVFITKNCSCTSKKKNIPERETILIHRPFPFNINISALILCTGPCVHIMSMHKRMGCMCLCVYFSGADADSNLESITESSHAITACHGKR